MFINLWFNRFHHRAIMRRAHIGRAIRRGLTYEDAIISAVYITSPLPSEWYVVFRRFCGWRTIVRDRVDVVESERRKAFKDWVQTLPIV